MKNILFLFETLASLSVAFFFWGFVILASAKRKMWIRFFSFSVLSLFALYFLKVVK